MVKRNRNSVKFQEKMNSNAFIIYKKKMSKEMLDNPFWLESN